MWRAGPPPDSFTYNSLLPLYKRAGGAANLGKATALFDWMRVAQPHAHADAATHAHAQGQGQGRGQMRRRGLPPDDVTVIAMITAYDSAGMHEEAAALLWRARAGDRQVDAVTVTSMLQTYLHAGKLREAEEVYARFVAEGGQPTLHLCSTLPSSGPFPPSALVYARQRQAAKAEGVFARMKASGLQLDGLAYGAMINCCSKSDGVPECACLPGYPTDASTAPSGQRDDPFREPAPGSPHLGSPLHPRPVPLPGARWRGRQSCLREMIAAGIKPTEVAYNSVIDMYGRAGDASTARAQAQPRAEGEGQGEGRLAPRLPHYSCLMSAYCRAGLVSRALAVFQELQQRGLKRWSMAPKLYTIMRVPGHRPRREDVQHASGHL
eukprot:jgi/Mesen1/1759/ME000014S01173